MVYPDFFLMVYHDIGVFFGKRFELKRQEVNFKDKHFAKK